MTSRQIRCGLPWWLRLPGYASKNDHDDTKACTVALGHWMKIRKHVTAHVNATEENPSFLPGTNLWLYCKRCLLF